MRVVHRFFGIPDDTCTLHARSRDAVLRPNAPSQHPRLRRASDQRHQYRPPSNLFPLLFTVFPRRLFCRDACASRCATLSANPFLRRGFNTPLLCCSVHQVHSSALLRINKGRARVHAHACSENPADGRCSPNGPAATILLLKRDYWRSHLDHRGKREQINDNPKRVSAAGRFNNTTTYAAMLHCSVCLSACLSPPPSFPPPLSRSICLRTDGTLWTTWYMR